jgi:hypothetical protein
LGLGPTSGNGITVDNLKRVTICGDTISIDLPQKNAIRELNQYVEQSYGFVATFGPGGDSLLFSSYIFSSEGDGASFVSADVLGGILVGGITNGWDFLTRHPYQLKRAGYQADGFLWYIVNSPLDSLQVFAVYVETIKNNLALMNDLQMAADQLGRGDKPSAINSLKLFQQELPKLEADHSITHAEQVKLLGGSWGLIHFIETL